MTPDLASVVVVRLVAAIAPARSTAQEYWTFQNAQGDARDAVKGLTDPEARTVALMTCENARVRTAALLAVSMQEVAR